MEVIASAKFLKISPKKIRPLLKDLRGKKVDEALVALHYSPHKAGKLLHKLISSASANASNNYNFKVDNLKIKKIVADDGPTFKRQWMRSRGSSDVILKRTAHLSVVLEEIIPTIKPKTTKPKTSKPSKETTPAKEDKVDRIDQITAKPTESTKQPKKLDVKRIFRRTTNK